MNSARTSASFAADRLELDRVSTFEQVEGYAPGGELIVPAPPGQPDQSGIDDDSEEFWAQALGRGVRVDGRPDYVGAILDPWKCAGQRPRGDTRLVAPS